MSSNPFIDDMLTELRAENAQRETTDEMSRRVGVPQYKGREFLAIERVTAKRQRRPVDMAHVAWAIKWTSEGRS